MSDLRLARALDGAGWTDILRWETSAPEAGTVTLIEAASGDTVFQIPLGSYRLEHSVPLPADLVPGEYTAIVLPAADAAESAGRLDFAIGGTGIRRWTLRESGTLPDGYLLPHPTDFDGDGIPEIVAMGYGGPGYNPAGFFELPSGSRPVHLSSRPFIPWNAHDLDGDGRSEIMAVDAERVRLVETAEPGSFPTEVVFEATEVWGGEVGDGDGDGRMEMFLRSSRSEQFRVFENSGGDSFAGTGILPNPSEGLDGLGDRQVAGDLDGDGSFELLAGDEDGDIFIYESIADDTWRNTWLERLEAGDSRVLGGAVRHRRRRAARVRGGQPGCEPVRPGGGGVDAGGCRSRRGQPLRTALERRGRRGSERGKRNQQRGFRRRRGSGNRRRPCARPLPAQGGSMPAPWSLSGTWRFQG